MLRPFFLLSGLLLVSGCSWPVRQVTNQVVHELADHPFDLAPPAATEPPRPTAEAPKSESGSPANSRPDSKTPAKPVISTDIQTTSWMESPADLIPKEAPLKEDDPLADEDSARKAASATTDKIKLDLNIPLQVPGAEVPRVVLPKDKDAEQRAIERLYPKLPPLPQEPQVLSGPGGKPYTLADLQRIAATNSPALRQAVADVEAAKGNLIQAKTYPNPRVGYLMNPSNNNDVAGVQGGFVDQPIVTGGKMKLGAAAAQMDVNNAILAMKRARSDLSTAVRKAYFTLLVDKETLIVTRALAQFTDDIYRIHTGLLRGSQAAPYEPASLRAQAFATRLAYQQAIASYVYDWKQLVATIGMHQLPLSEVSGQVDRFIPYFDYDEVLHHALRHHTDMLTAHNVIKKAQYNLKLAQITPLFPNLDVYASVERDYSDTPYGTYQTIAIGFPLSIWDQNKGNIVAAQAGLVRGGEETHRVEMDLTNNLASAYGNYKNNLYAMEYYRRNILPDLVRYYRGIFARRQVDPTTAFNDLVTAQQTLSANVTVYLNVLDSLWSSVVNVADLLQTDDLFQLARPRGLPELPDFNRLALWRCDHPELAQACVNGAGSNSPSIVPPSAALLSSPPAGVTTAAPSAVVVPSVAPRQASPPTPPTTPTSPFGARRDPVLDPPRVTAPVSAAVK